MRFFPDASAALIWAAEFEGCAMKKELIGRDDPLAEPDDQVVPAEFSFALGTKTLNLPSWSI